MKFKAALFYNGAIAYYNIYLLGQHFYKIRLDSYNGKNEPPSLIELYKKGTIWQSNCDDHILIKELKSAIEQKLN